MVNLSVEELYSSVQGRLSLEIVNGTYSFRKMVKEGELNRPGLALAGFTKVFTYDRIQVLGNTEMRFLEGLNSGDRREAIQTALNFDIPCIVVTDNNPIRPEFVDIANQRGITVFRTPLKTTQFTHLLGDFLDEKFAPTTTVHGTLVDVFGVGMLFTGRSGIGKSEIALDLIERGHRLVADDVVLISRKAAGILTGQGSEMLKYHMEIRGLGIIDIRSIFGIHATRPQKRIEVEVHLEEWDNSEDYERIGVDEQYKKILDVEIPFIKIPIFPGKNITVIAEVVAMSQLLKVSGHNMARDFDERLKRKIQSSGEEPFDMERYLERDFE